MLCRPARVVCAGNAAVKILHRGQRGQSPASSPATALGIAQNCVLYCVVTTSTPEPDTQQQHGLGLALDTGPAELLQQPPDQLVQCSSEDMIYLHHSSLLQCCSAVIPSVQHRVMRRQWPSVSRLQQRPGGQWPLLRREHGDQSMITGTAQCWSLLRSCHTVTALMRETQGELPA